MRIVLLAVAISAMFMACSKSDAEIIIEATREAEAVEDVEATATVVAEDETARELLIEMCDAMERRYKTDRSLPSIYVQRIAVADDWLMRNADSNSEARMIADAFLMDARRVTDGEYVSWHDAFQQSGSKYLGDCKTASWK